VGRNRGNGGEEADLDQKRSRQHDGQLQENTYVNKSENYGKKKRKCFNLAAW
jgi:hypothetical protein